MINKININNLYKNKIWMVMKMNLNKQITKIYNNVLKNSCK
jgi:hypothetical protein